MILVNAICWDGSVIPAGMASDREDVEKMKKWAVENYNLNRVVDWEIINNPTPEDLQKVNEIMKNFVTGQIESKRSHDLEEIFKLYDERTINGEEARNRITVLYADAEPERREKAIELLYAPNHGWPEDDYGDYDEDYDGYDEEDEDEDDEDCPCLC